MQRNGKLGSDCVERVELLMKNLGFRKNVSTNRTEGSQSGRCVRSIWKANRLGQHLRIVDPACDPENEMSDWQATLASYLARVSSVLFDNREKGMLVKLATLSTQVRAGIQGNHL
jgi:hypothetical protein